MASLDAQRAELRCTPDVDTIWASVDASLSKARAVSRPMTVLIDGAAGAGKTSLAAEFASRWPADRELLVIHMDDVYEGWAGLEAGIVELGEEVLARRVLGEASRIRVYDWNTESMSPGPQIPANVDLVVEGCGSLGALHAESAGVRLWIDAPADLRRVRALSREGEDFERHWDMWEDQFTGYVERVRPQNIASLVIRANR